MDPLSAAASVIAVVQISAKIFELCRTYALGVKSATEDINRLQSEVAEIQLVMEKVKYLADGDTNKLSTLQTLKDNGTLERLSTDLATLATKLAPKLRRRLLNRIRSGHLKWPFQKADVDQLITALDRHKSTILLALSADQRLERNGLVIE